MKRFNQMTEIQMSKAAGGGFVLLALVGIILAIVGASAATVGQATSHKES